MGSGAEKKEGGRTAGEGGGGGVGPNTNDGGFPLEGYSYSNSILFSPNTWVQLKGLQGGGGVETMVGRGRERDGGGGQGGVGGLLLSRVLCAARNVDGLF